MQKLQNSTCKSDAAISWTYASHQVRACNPWQIMRWSAHCMVQATTQPIVVKAMPPAMSTSELAICRVDMTVE